MTSPRYPEIDDAWDRFRRGEAREAVAFLIDLVRRPPVGPLAVDRRLLAVQALGELGATLGDVEGRRFRLFPDEVAIAALADRAVPVLAELLADPDGRIRHRACAALRQIGPPAAAAAPALRQLQEGPDGLLRMFAARALAAIEPTAPAND